MNQTEINTNIKLQDRLMKRIFSGLNIKVIAAIAMAIIFHSTADAQTQSDADQLKFRQYSIESLANVYGSDSPDFDGAITFYFLNGDSKLNSGQFLEWINDGTVTVDGVIFDKDQAILAGMKKLTVPYKFSTELNREYYPTHARYFGNHLYMEDVAPLSLYPDKNHEVVWTLKSEQKADTAITQSSFSIHPVLINAEHTIPHNQYYSVNYMKPEKEMDSGKSFINRNRFWVISATTLALSGTAAIITSTGGSKPVFLPEPPGRP